MDGFVYVGGRIVPRDAAVVSAFDRGFLYGDGLFETLRSYGGVPFLLDEHLARMAASAAELGIVMPPRDLVTGAVGELLRRNGLADAYIRITLSRGVHTGALAPEERLEPTLVIDVRELHAYAPELYERGAAAIVSSIRHDSSSLLRRHKTTGYLASVLARREAKARGADEAVLLDPAGWVAEGATSNIFCVRGGRVLTPPLELNILPGITRATVLRLAREAGLDAGEERFDLETLTSAAEVFLTSSVMGLLRVRRIDACPLSASPGPAARLLAGAYERATRGASFKPRH